MVSQLLHDSFNIIISNPHPMPLIIDNYETPASFIASKLFKNSKMVEISSINSSTLRSLKEDTVYYAHNEFLTESDSENRWATNTRQNQGRAESSDSELNSADEAKLAELHISLHSVGLMGISAREIKDLTKEICQSRDKQLKYYFNEIVEVGVNIIYYNKKNKTVKYYTVRRDSLGYPVEMDEIKETEEEIEKMDKSTFLPHLDAQKEEIVLFPEEEED